MHNCYIKGTRDLLGYVCELSMTIVFLSIYDKNVIKKMKDFFCVCINHSFPKISVRS